MDTAPISGLVPMIHVADVERSAAFYRLLGFEIGNAVPRGGSRTVRLLAVRLPVGPGGVRALGSAVRRVAVRLLSAVRRPVMRLLAARSVGRPLVGLSSGRP